MPLYSDTSLYSLPSYALYLSSPYAGHSSLISSYSRPAFSKPLSRYHRNFAPHLATISENQVTALRRKYSPRLRLSASTFTVPRPIKINTADIDISANKYRLQNVKATPEKEEVIKGEEGKPIRRDRATVRLHTVHKDKKDKRWRQNFNSFELNIDNSKNKKEEDEKETEEVQLPKSPSFHDICKAISTDSINEELNPGQPAHVIRKQSRTYSNEDLSNRIRRNSAEILKGNIEALDQPTNEDINNNELKRPTKTEDSFESRVSVRKKKKVAKKKSQTELNSSQPEETEAHPTHPSPQRRNAKNSSFKDITKVEVEEMRKKPKPLFTATVDVEEPKPNLKLIIDDVKVEESPKLKPKKFKLNVTVQVDEKPKLKKKIDDKGKMYIPNSKPALVTNIKKKEQRGSLGDIWEGIEGMPKRKSLGGNQENDRDEPNQEKEETTDRNQQTDNNEKEVTEQYSLEIKNNNLGITKNNVEVNNRDATENNNKEIEVIDKINKDIEVRSVQLQADKTELNTNKIGLNEDEIKLVDKNNQISDNKSGINTKNLGINTIEDEIGRNEEATSNKSAVESLENNISGLKRKDENLRSKSPEKEEKVGFPRVRTRKEGDVSSINDQKLAEEKKQILKPNKNQEDLLTPDENANQSKEDVNVGLKWTQKLNCDSAKEKKALKLKLNDVNSKIEEETGKDTTPIINTNQNQKRDSDALKDNNKRGFDGKSPKIEEKKENKMIPKWKQDLKKAQQDKIPKNEGIKSIMKDSKVDGVRDYKKCVSIEEKQTRAEEENEDNENMDFWDIIGAKSSVYEKKPIELKSVPFNSFGEGQEETTQEPEEEIQNQEETEQQQSTDDLLESEESKDEVPRLKPVSKRSLVNKATDEDPDLQVFVPPPKPPTPEPQPQEFVPLQSNRLTQWMHPFKKPEQFDECPIEIYARPKIIRKRHFPKPRHVVAKESDSEETSSEGESSAEEGNVGKSTSSNDSGFNSSNGCGQNLNDKDCDVNIHRKCEKLTANLCGINQKLIVEAIESVKKGSSDARDSPTSNPAHNPAFALDACDAVDAEFQMSSTYASFQKSGRITPPATTIPRFRKYTIDDFNFLKVLGKGSFGKVLLAELKDTEYYYAIKCLKKDVVLEDDDVECTLIERKVLALGTKHPYLCHLLCTFQTESHLFFVMEYLNGGDLMFHIQQSGRFPEPRARFYGAEIVSGLKFLHNKGIVYRDLKLDNVLLDFDGHVRIADFGMCKLQIFLDRMADTFCGTPDYMAPEIIKGQHYNQCVDWWSFGILLYEMLIGQSPFSGCDEDELFWSICNEKPVFPRFLSAEANSVLTQLLEKDWNKRLGNKLSPHGDIQDNPFFRPIAWDLLEMRHLEAPFKPNLQHPLDTQYFDKTFTVEKAKLTPIEKNILQSMDQTQFQGFSYTNPNATDR